MNYSFIKPWRWPAWFQGALIGYLVLGVLAFVIEEFLTPGGKIGDPRRLYYIYEAPLFFPFRYALEKPDRLAEIPRFICSLPGLLFYPALGACLLVISARHQERKQILFSKLSPLLVYSLTFLVWLRVFGNPNELLHDFLGWLPLLLVVILPLIFASSVWQRLLMCLTFLIPASYWSIMLTDLPDTGGLVYLLLVPFMVVLVPMGHFLLQIPSNIESVGFKKIAFLILVALNLLAAALLLIR